MLRSLTYTNPQLYYAFNHMVDEPPLALGQELQPGDPIGVMGASGRVSGPHLHFEVYKDNKEPGSRIDPMPLIKMNMQKIAKNQTEILSYSCESLRARIRGGPSQPSGGAANKVNR